MMIQKFYLIQRNQIFHDRILSRNSRVFFLFLQFSLMVQQHYLIAIDPESNENQHLTWIAELAHVDDLVSLVAVTSTPQLELNQTGAGDMVKMNILYG